MTQATPNRQIAEEAADWAVRLDAGPLDDAERRALAQWLAASPVHVDELLYSASIFSGMDHVDAGKTISIDALLAAHAPEVVPLFADAARQAEDDQPAPVRESWRAGSNSRWMAIAATLVLMVAATLFLAPSLWKPGGEAGIAYGTGDGEQRSITLEDGSIVHLNTSSQVRVSLARSERRIDLLSGEALFEVAHDSTRPFRVFAGETMSQAVGTKFNVQRDSGGIHVMVVEGKVLVRNDAAPQFAGSTGHENKREVLVVAGNRADVDERFAAPRVSAADVAEMTLWRMRQLSFDKQTLASIATEFNRYNRMQMVVVDEQLAGTRFSGGFNSNDPDSFLAFLELTPGIEIDRSDPDRVVLSLRRP